MVDLQHHIKNMAVKEEICYEDVTEDEHRDSKMKDKNIIDKLKFENDIDEYGIDAARRRISADIGPTSCGTVKQETCYEAISETEHRDNEMDLENKSDRLKPDTLGATGSSVGTEPSDEKQLPFPGPIQLRVYGLMKTECKIEPPDDGPPTIKDDSLKSEDSVDEEHLDITITEVKVEPQDTDMLE